MFNFNPLKAANINNQKQLISRYLSDVTTITAKVKKEPKTPKIPKVIKPKEFKEPKTPKASIETKDKSVSSSNNIINIALSKSLVADPQKKKFETTDGDIVNTIASKLVLPEKLVNTILIEFRDTLIDQVLTQNKVVQIIKLGKFETRVTKPGSISASGKTINFPARTRMFFKPSTTLKKIV